MGSISYIPLTDSLVYLAIVFFSSNYFSELADIIMAETFKKSYFEVLGICCASEVALVERILKSLSGVKEISVILPTKTVIVVYDSNFTSEIQVGMSTMLLPQYAVRFLFENDNMRTGHKILCLDEHLPIEMNDRRSYA